MSRKKKPAEPSAAAKERTSLYNWAATIEKEMRKIVERKVGKNPPEGFDPLTLLDDPEVGAELRRLGEDWTRTRAKYWALVAEGQP